MAKSPTKTPAKKSGAKTSTKNSSGARTPATKSPGAKTSAKKPVSSKSTRKYSPAASAQVAEDLHEMHKGKLHIGTSDKLVTNPKQAIAIGLAQARRAGKKVPPNPNDPKK